MKLLKKIVRNFSLSKSELHESIENLSTPKKRRKTLEASDDVPHQIIDVPVGSSILELSEQQFNAVKRRAQGQLEQILKKALKMSKKEASRTVASLSEDPKTASSIQVNSIFGCPLSQLPAHLINPDTQLPTIIIKLMQSFMARGGFEQEGPFRFEGDKNLLSELVAGISKGFENEVTSIDSYPLPVVAAAIKRYIRNISGSLISNSATILLSKISHLKDVNLKEMAIKLTILSLPYRNVKVFSCVNLFLKACAAKQDIHKMSASSLSVCFGPTMFDIGIDINLVNDINNLLSNVIENYSKYFFVPPTLA